MTENDPARRHGGFRPRTSSRTTAAWIAGAVVVLTLLAVVLFGTALRQEPQPVETLPPAAATR